MVEVSAKWDLTAASKTLTIAVLCSLNFPSV